MAQLYYVIYPSAGADPSAAQIKAGQQANGTPATAAGNELSPTVTTTPYIFTAPAAGLTPSTSYKVAFTWSDGDADSNVSVSGAWSTLAAAVANRLSDVAVPYSVTPGVVPSGGASGAVAVNIADQKLFIFR